MEKSCNQILRNKCNETGISKLIYLCSMTFLTSGFILECILLHLMLTPYLAEQEFEQTTCIYKNSSSRFSLLADLQLRCENKCTKDTGKFPCVWLLVKYVTHTPDQKKYQHGYLYDYYRTYNRYKKQRCSTSPCHLVNADNTDWVISFDRSLSSRHNFSCYYNTKDHQSVLLYKLYPKTLILHCILWPFGIFILGLLGITFTALCAGCDVWKNEDVVIA